MAGENTPPIVVKRKKVVAGDGHHGGAWKVAYADFVTAMMAFFMLMWLLGATTEKQRKGIADYFNPTIPVVRASGGGSGAFGGDSIFSEQNLNQSGTGGGQARPTEERRARGELGTSEGEGVQEQPTPSETEEKVLDALQGSSGESMMAELLRRHIVSRLSDEGLVIELFETPDAPLFTDDTEPTAILRDLVASLVPILDLAVNDVAVQAHVRASPIVLQNNPSWVLTSARANATRQLLEASGLAEGRLVRVTGFADRRPVTENPMAARNDRLEIILLRTGS